MNGLDHLVAPKLGSMFCEPNFSQLACLHRYSNVSDVFLYFKQNLRKKNSQIKIDFTNFCQYNGNSLDCVEPAKRLISCVTICPHCILANVNCGSGMSCSPNAANETKRAFGNSSPVIDNVGEEKPSPYFALNKREYRRFATPHNGLTKLLQLPIYVYIFIKNIRSFINKWHTDESIYQCPTTYRPTIDMATERMLLRVPHTENLNRMLCHKRVEVLGSSPMETPIHYIFEKKIKNKN